MILVANDRSNQALSNKLVSNDMGSLFEVPDAQICQKWQSYILAAINDIYIYIYIYIYGVYFGGKSLFSLHHSKNNLISAPYFPAKKFVGAKFPISGSLMVNFGINHLFRYISFFYLFTLNIFTYGYCQNIINLYKTTFFSIIVLLISAPYDSTSLFYPSRGGGKKVPN